MDNILYLDDYINFYSKRLNKIIVSKPYKHTLNNGLIIDKEKFYKKFKSIIEKNNLEKNFFSESITIVINNLYKDINKKIIKELLESLNYKNIRFINELDYLKIEKNKLYINYNYSYFYILHLDTYGNVSINLYKNDNINKKIINDILLIIKPKKIYLYGKNYKEIENIINKDKFNYYFFEDADNLIINLMLSNKKV